jgi:predicted Zn finger-like uncharacterized protein
MILTCSKCSTQFTVSAAALGTAGRKVKCSKCAHTWHQAPEAATPSAVQVAAPAPAAAPTPTPAAPPVAPAAAPAPSPTSLSPDSPAPLTSLSPDSPPPSPLDREPVVSPAFAEKTVVVVKKQAGPALKLFTAFSLLLMVASGALAGLPRLKMPALVPVKEAIGLADTSDFIFQKIAFQATPSSSPGKMKLTFTGQVKNTRTEKRFSPPVTVTLYDRAGREVRSLEYQFPVTQVDGGKTLDFEPKINNIPDSLSRVMLDLGNPIEQLLR